MGIGRSFQRTNIFATLTRCSRTCRLPSSLITAAARNFWARSEDFYRDETAALLASIGLDGQANAIAGTLSYGNQKQLELGIALASDPALLLLDEPTAGMSATETHETMRLLRRIAGERGLTLLFTEHDMEVVFAIAEKIAVLHQGRMLAEGRPDEVRGDPEVRRVYLGGHCMTALLSVEEIHTAYGLSRVLFGISLEIEAGECVCLLGRNGVGKTTTIRSIMGLTPPSGGHVRWQGKDIPAGRRTALPAPESALSPRTAASSPS